MFRYLLILGGIMAFTAQCKSILNVNMKKSKYSEFYKYFDENIVKTIDSLYRINLNLDLYLKVIELHNAHEVEFKLYFFYLNQDSTTIYRAIYDEKSKENLFQFNNFISNKDSINLFLNDYNCLITHSNKSKFQVFEEYIGVQWVKDDSLKYEQVGLLNASNNCNVLSYLKE